MAAAKQKKEEDKKVSPEDAEVAEREEKRVRAPVAVRVRSAGQVSASLDRFAARYRELNPNREVRYVYDPTHKPELSGVMGRQAMGYRLVMFGDLEMDVEHVTDSDVVRVGDLVLMSIDAKTKQDIRAERDARAKEQLKMVEREFYETVEEDADALTPEHHAGPATRPIGRAAIQEKSFEYDVEQRKE